jgi:hypothetical protein
MPAAIRPYSIAVAPLSSCKKFFNTNMLYSMGKGGSVTVRFMPDNSQR